MENILETDKPEEIRLDNWYVIQVLTGKEFRMAEDVKLLLDKHLYEMSFSPAWEKQYRRQGKTFSRKRPLFPGYFIIVSDYIDEVAAALWKTAEYKRLLRTGESITPMGEEEVKRFLSLADENFNISLSIGFIEGDAITITEGPLKGSEGLIKKVDRHKREAFVEVPFLSTYTRVRVPLEIVDKR